MGTLIKISEGGWTLIAFISIIIIGFIYLYLNVNGNFEKFKKKK